MFNVRVIGDDALPVNHDWAMIELDGRLTFCVKRTALGSATMIEAHRAFWTLKGRQAAASFALTL